MVTMGELFAYPRLCNVSMERVSLSQPETERFLLEEGDLLFARQSLVLEGAGRCSIFLRDDEPVTFESHLTRVRLDQARAYPPYYFYYFQSHHGRSAIRSIVEQGAGASGIRGSDLAVLEVQWRPLRQQQSIAHILGALDDKIDLNRRMNGTLEQIARAIFEDWFVDFGPVRAKLESQEPYLPLGLWDLFPDRLVDSELGEIPDGWEVKALGEVASLNPESWAKANSPARVEYVDLANTKWGVIESTQQFLWKDAPSRARRVLRSGDTIVGTVRPGNGSYSLIGEDGLTGSTGFAVLRPLHPRFRELIYLSATAPENLERLAHRADGAAYPAIRSEIVAETEVAIPTEELNVLDWFSKTVGAILDKVESAKTESRSLASQRDALLPKLVSGELQIRKTGGQS